LKTLIDKLSNIRKEIVGWITFLAMCWAGFTWGVGTVVKSEIAKSEERIIKEIRDESHKNLYAVFSQFYISYKAIENPKPYQVAMAEEVKSKRDHYLHLIEREWVLGNEVE